MHLPFGTIERAFGFERLKILEFIEALLTLQSKTVDEALLEQDIFTLIFVILFFSFSLFSQMSWTQGREVSNFSFFSHEIHS
jgi:hypothetical protein